MTTNHTDEQSTPTRSALVLVPGFWLGAWAWDGVVPVLRERGHAVTPVTLPGLDPDDPARTTRTHDDQVDFLAHTVAKAAVDGPVTLVVHSGAAFPAMLLIARNPDAVERVIFVDSGPLADGSAFNPELPDDVAEVPLPDVEALDEGDNLAGLDEAMLQRFRQRAVPQPGPVVREPISLRDERRLAVPTTIIACSIPSQTMMSLARDGHPMMAETARYTDLTLVDLPTGHWPMWSRPHDLADTISEAATR
jgi:pimeloyl-ACP methyl ester carboxylesterase